MSLLPLSLGTGRKTGAGGTVFKNRSQLRSEMEKALWRDAHTCRCCGFQASKYQRVIPADPGQDADDAFITVCLFCEACFALDKAGMAGAGVLIWLPEISQADLHHIMRAIYVVRDSGHPLAEKASKAFDALMARRTEVKKRLGSDDPLLLATVLTEALTEAEYDKRAAKLEGIRLLPLDRWFVRGRGGDANHFPAIVKYWRSPEGPFGKLPPETWGPMFDSVIARAGKPH
ncbi:MAG: type IV secretion protein DotN [Alphaproteobacteria bacterium]|nr:type IV secretion protein DotN [Alphaproteobacteria bacterium]